MSKDRRTVHCVPGTTSHGRESLVHLVALGPKEAPEVISFLLSAILGSTCLLSSNDAISQTNSAFLLPKDMGSGPSLGREGVGKGPPTGRTGCVGLASAVRTVGPRETLMDFGTCFADLQALRGWLR